MARNSGLLVRLAVATPILWAVVVVATDPQPEGSRYDPSGTSGWDATLVVMFVAGLAALMVFNSFIVARFRANVIRIARPVRVVAMVLVVLAVFIGQLLLMRALAKTPSFDAGFVLGMSYAHAFPGAPDPVLMVPDNYYSVFPNNLVLGAAFSLLFSLVGALVPLDYAHAVMLASAVNAAFLLAALVLTIDCVRRLFGVRSAVMVAPFGLALLVLSPWLNTPYSDTIGAFFAILGVRLFLLSNASRHRSVVSLVLFSTVGALAFALKPTLCFSFAALAGLLLWQRRPTRQELRSAVAVCAGLVAPFVAVHYGLLLAVQATHFVAFDVFHPPAAMSFTVFMAEGSRGLGGFDYGIFSRAANVGGPSEKFWFGLNEYWSNVTGMGPVRYLQFLGMKLLWMLGDGSFFQGHEGDSFPSFFHTDAASAGVQSAMVLGGATHSVVASLWQASWLTLLLLAAGAAVIHRPSRTPVVTVLFTAIGLLLLFLLLFEGRSRYVYMDVPLLMLLAAAALAVTRHSGDRPVVLLRLHRLRDRLDDSSRTQSTSESESRSGVR